MEGLLGDGAWALVLFLVAQAHSQHCAGPCNCTGVAAQCPEGVPLVTDGCQCCQICARQKGESCDGRYICDVRRGLQCDYSASDPGAPGVCVRQDEAGCDVGGVWKRSGEKFQEGCSGSCTCFGGAVRCVSLCPPIFQPATPDCPHPRQVTRPGECCEVWVCGDEDAAVENDTQTVYRPHGRWPGISDDEWNWIQNQSRIQSSFLYQTQNQDQTQTQTQISASECAERSTEWSACSRSCGRGVSVRVSNQNPTCRPETQMRFCEVRPCWAVPPETQTDHGRCKASYRSVTPHRLQIGVCESLQFYQPRYCSRSCSPFWTRTELVTFACPTEGRFAHYRPTLYQVMVIDSCVCHSHCPESGTASPGGPEFQA